MQRIVASHGRGGAPVPAPSLPHRSHPAWAGLLALQRSAGNRALAERLVQRRPAAPDPLDLASSAPGPFEGAVSSDSYDRQPEALRVVLDASGRALPLPTSVFPTGQAERHRGALWWSRLDRQQRATVTSLYNRMQSLGLWPFVHRIHRVTHAECPVLRRFRVSGDTPSVVFGGDAAGLVGALTGSSRMCYDAGVGGSLHPGQMSNREISDTDSLHVSVGRGDLGRGEGDFDAHIDRYAPPKGRRGLACEYDVDRTLLHQGREVIPSLVRKHTGLPGLEVFPEETDRPGVRPEMFEDLDRDDEAPPVAAGLTYRFGR